MRDGRVRANNAVIAKRHSGHDGCPEAEEAASPDGYRALRSKRLPHDQAGMGVHAVELVGDVDLLAEDTTVADRDFVDCREVRIAADVYVVTDFDQRLVIDSRIICDCLDMQSASDDGSFTDFDPITSGD